MMMGSVNGSVRASAPSHVTRNNHLHLGVNGRPSYGYSFQGNVGPNEHYDPFPHGGSSIRPVGLEAPEVAFMGYHILNSSTGSLFGRLAGAAPVEQSMNLPSPPGSQTPFQAEGSGMVDVQLPDVGEALLALSADVQPGDGIDGSSEDILSDVEEPVEDLSE
ncbi:uncharacterized protein LOC115751744 [Rhodamnia argentea]|uniref:Uncharacterized protein LOC115751744 n=1 Tax=Rhodamnia argentea TaxID=178133 RepID=A0A8B8QGA6_9MYRT|nr:uncharacterized protein LOC115751744 [Rhodamnia argentea]